MLKTVLKRIPLAYPKRLNALLRCACVLGLYCTLAAVFTGCLQVEIVGSSSRSSTSSVGNSLRVDLLAGQISIPNPSAGSSDGTGSNAKFSGPTGITTDGTYLFVVDSANETIRQIVIATGAVTTLAGTAGVIGFANGVGASASFNFDWAGGITWSGGNLYVSDFANNTIRKIVVATGQVTTLAGTAGTSGTTDASGAAARFHGPGPITNDGVNLYVEDGNSNTIRQIVMATGAVTTLVGTGEGWTYNGWEGLTASGGSLYVWTSGAYEVDTGTGAVTSLGGSAWPVMDCTYSVQAIFGCGTGFAHGDMATDGTNIYFVNAYNNTISQFAIGTWAGSALAGTPWVVGSQDGTGLAASFNFTQSGGITVTGGNLYVSDTSNNTIRKVVIATGAVSTLAGLPPSSTQDYGSADGVGINAGFSQPIGITVDGTNAFVEDTLNETIRKINLSTGAVTTLAGTPGVIGSADGTGAAASFDLKMGDGGLVSDGTHLYVSDYWNNTIREIVISTGVVTTVAGTAGVTGSADGTGAAASFNRPTGLASDGTFLYISDSRNYTVRKMNLTTKAVTTLAGTAGTHGSTDATGAAATFTYTSGMVLVGSQLFVVDTGLFDGTYHFTGGAIRQIDTGTGAVTTLAGNPSVPAAGIPMTDGVGAAATFEFPYGIATDGTNLYVTDYDVVRKVVIATGSVTTLQNRTYDFGVYLAYDDIPAGGIASDGSNLYVAENSGNFIDKISIATLDATLFAGGNTLPPNIGFANGNGLSAVFSGPIGLVTDGTNIYVSDNGNGLVRQIDIASNVVTNLAGSLESWGSTDGVGTAAEFKGPGDLALASGSLYVVDEWNNTIREINTTTADVTTFAGTAGTTGSADGVGAAASFNFNDEAGLTTDGNFLYVASGGDNIIRKISIAGGVVTTLAGAAGVTGAIDGVGPAASFQLSGGCSPGITTDNTNLYVSDQGNNTIRKIVIATGAVSTLAGVAGAGGYSDGAGVIARFWNPCGISTDGTNLYVSDFGNQTIRKIVIATGVVSTMAGSPGVAGDVEGSVGSVLLNFPSSILYTPAGTYFVDGWSDVRWLH